MRSQTSAWLILAASVLAEVLGTLALRHAEAFTKPLPSLAVVFCYASAIWLMSVAGQQLEVGLMYAVWAGSGTAHGGVGHGLVSGAGIAVALEWPGLHCPGRGPAPPQPTLNSGHQAYRRIGTCAAPLHENPETRFPCQFGPPKTARFLHDGHQWPLQCRRGHLPKPIDLTKDGA